MNRTVSHKRTAARVVVVLAALGGAAVYAAIPGAGGLINACYSNLNGRLRAIDVAAGQSCNALETPISWNQVGPPGPTGPPGATGLSGYEIVSENIELSGCEIQCLEHATLACPPGKVAVGGGYGTAIVDTSVTIVGSAPTETGDGWEVSLDRGPSFSALVSMRVICVSAM